MGICVIVDTADDRVRCYCHGDCVRDGVPVTCGADAEENDCYTALAGQTLRHYDGTKAEFETACLADSTTCTEMPYEMDGCSYDGADFGELTLLTRP